ncbi:MAG: PBP1A family penicillin-binding protein [Xanthobacteraceae bacterium]|nr:PBP1A family penicillin-binding protein [Xanthobacteraceae bacterium]
MRELYPDPEKEWKPRFRHFLLDSDARFDNFLFHTGRWVREIYERFSMFMDRFHVGGWRRWVFVEPFSEGATMAAGGLVLMLALALPAFREVTDDDWLKNSEFAVTFLDRYGNEIGNRGIKHNDSILLSDFPDALIKATLATEDRRFYEHFGIDIPGTMRALLTNAQAGGVRQGGSSITQQLAKNLFLTNERTIERKVKEAFLAIWLESRLTKNDILKLYLDRAYLGGGAFGVDAAAQFYFNKSAKDVTLAEASMLAGLFKAPAKFAPHINLPAARARANVVLDNLVESGMMSEGQVFGARRNPAMSLDRRDDRSPNYFLDYAFDEMKKLVGTFPKSMTERVFLVRTSLDSGLQRVAETTVENNLRQFGRDYHASQTAVVIADLEGSVRAMVGGRDYTSSQFNRATDALRQPGSSFKPYVYATALQTGMKPSSIVVDGPLCIGNWCPHNYSGGYSGSMTLTQALQRSINTVAVKLSISIGNGNAGAGRAKIVANARAMGLRTPLIDTPSLPIGAGEVTVLDHTVAFATFPNGGKSVTAHGLLEVRTGNGEVVWRFDRDGPKPRQVLPAQVALDMNMMMNKAAEEGTGRRAILNGIRIAGKTGTTNNYRDAWFVGFTGNLVGGVWIGNDDYQSTNRMTGGSLPAMTWQPIMTYAHQGIEIKPIPGIESGPGPVAQARPPAAGADKTPAAPPPLRPTVLTQRGATVLVRIEHMMEDASRVLVASGAVVSELPAGPANAAMRPEALASATSDSAPGAVRGN